MTIDSSALLAILFDEAERVTFIEQIQRDPKRLMSAATILEVSMVLAGRTGEAGESRLDLLLQRAGITIVPFDAEQLTEARIAFLRFGKGRHAAGLNFGDCISYALSKSSGEPLLFKGDDFAKTDVTPAM